MNSRALIQGIGKVTAKWCKQRKREEREASAQLNRWDAMTRRHSMSIKEAAWSVMDQAYLKASANGTLPAHARQIMYAARGEILRLTGKDQLEDAYFTQTLLPDYINENSNAQTWDVVYDARGHFQEPHGSSEVSLGTINVRDYLKRVASHEFRQIAAGIIGGDRYPTQGPKHRFGAILFIEKEGFKPLFDRVSLAQRFDLAIMSTKGVSNTASRMLFDQLCGQHKIPLFVLHDFDADGFKILGTLSNDTRRYSFANSIQVIDLGLRLTDVQECKLESEAVSRKRSAEDMLIEYGASNEEIDFLESRRVELNAFPSDQLIAWLERKLTENGIEKVIPDAETQSLAYRRAIEATELQKAIDGITPKIRDRASKTPIPKGLDRQIRKLLKENPAMAWDKAVTQLARQRACIALGGMTKETP